MNESDQDKKDLISGVSPVEPKASSSEVVLPHRGTDAPITKDDISQQADAARQQLLELQRKREELEREKNELEELRRKQDEYQQGRREMLDQLNRCLVILEHEDVE